MSFRPPQSLYALIKIFPNKLILYKEYLLQVSDHKPVSALFSVGIKVIDKAKRQKIREEIMKKLDMLENDFLPQVRRILTK